MFEFRFVGVGEGTGAAWFGFRLDRDWDRDGTDGAWFGSREGAPKGWSTVLIAALGRWRKLGALGQLG
jgi:hypothetical protein